MNENRSIKRKKILLVVLEGCTIQGMAIPANQQISGKIAKMALFNPCMKLDKMTFFEVFKNSLSWILLIKCLWSKGLSKWINVDNWDYFQNRSQDFFFSFNLYLSFWIWNHCLIFWWFRSRSKQCVFHSN